MAVSNTLAKKRTEAFQNVQSASYEVGGLMYIAFPLLIIGGIIGLVTSHS